MTKIFYFILTFLISQVSSLSNIEVFRLFAYEENGRLIGSKVTNFNLIAAHYSDEILRKIAIISFADINEINLVKTLQRKPAGVLIILPNETKNVEFENNIWQSFYKIVANKTIQIPIYFCQESQSIVNLYQNLTPNNTDKTQKTSSKGDQFKIIVQSQEAKQISSVQYEDYTGYLEESVKGRSNLATILFVSNYDLDPPSPELQGKLKNQDKNLIAFFSVIKKLTYLFKVYSKINYNVIFYLTGSQSLDYDGLNQWIVKHQGNLNNQIEFVIILGNLIDSSQLQVEYFNPSEDVEQQSRIQDVVKDTGKQYDIKINNTLHQKSIISGMKDTLVIRISDVQASKKTFIYHGKDTNKFDKKINLITEVLMKLIYNLPYENAFFNEKSIDNTYFTSQVEEMLNQTKRSINYLHKDSDANKQIKKIFDGLFQSYQKFNYFNKDKKFYNSKPINAQIARYYDPFINLYLFGIVLAWLGFIYFIFQKNVILKTKEK